MFVSINEILNTFNDSLTVGVSVGAFIIGIAISGIAAKTKKALSLSGKHDKEMMNLTQEENQRQIKIHEKLAIFRNETNSDRVTIAQFHNGGKFLDGSPMKKFSVTHESCSAGTSIEGPKTQNIPLSMLWEFVDYIQKEPAIIFSVKSLQDTYIRSWFETRGSERFSLFPIKKDGLYYGFFLAEWTQENADNTDIEKSKFVKNVAQTVHDIQVHLYVK